MKKIFALVFATIMAFGLSAQDTLSFSYTAGADLNTAWLWRGIYNGGLSFQPTAMVGWSSEHTSFMAGAWANIGAADGTFKEEGDTICNGEVDAIAFLNVWGATIGFTHYNYWGKPHLWSPDRSIKYQNEITVGYDFSTLLNVPLTIMWNTVINDGTNTNEDKLSHYSTYVDITYSHDFDKGWNLTGSVGFTPWKSMYTNYEGDFAINNISLMGSKTWSIKNVCGVTLYAQCMMNPYFLGFDVPGFQGIWGCAGCSVRF